MPKNYIYTDDATLVADCLKYNAAAQYYLYQKYASKFLGICIRYTNDTDTANEYLQQGFIRIYDYLHQYKNNGSLEGWMKRVLINTILNELKKHKKHKSYLEIDAVENIPVQILSDRDYDVDIIMKCIAQLPYGYRTILNLYAIDGFTHAEIAINLNITESTSRSQFNRAKNYLKKILNEINVLEDKKYNYEQK